MMSKIKDLLIGVLFGLLSAGLILLVSRPKPGRAVLLRPAPTPRPVVINIDGAVASPGVYTLPFQSRVMDAVKAAGGLAENASPGSVNLAAELEDGSHIYIPARNSSLESPAEMVGSVIGLAVSGELISMININQASLEVLLGLPGIGPVTAEKIINYREEQLFTRIEEIQKVPGIGPATYEQIKIYLTVGE
ncbi:MAG: ComEA family DNA-binding protein [Anaerolineales bacterium]|nr:ComEA family DNA-binding protein [Anaerolineales bacterium]